MDRGRSIRRIGQACMLALMVLVLLAQSGLAAGIRVVPSVERVLPGEDFYLDIVAEDVPVDDGLGTVQFRLNVAAPGARVTGVPDLGQASADSVAIATPLLISEPTATRSGLGPFFQSLYQGSEGILVLDNEPLANGSALFTYAHTNGANRPAGTGAVARFRVRVGAAVAAEKIDISLTDVLLLDGGPAYPLDSNVGATVTLRCTASVPDLAGRSLTEAQSALTSAGLTLGSIYEISNPGSAQPLGVVLEHSAPVGSELDCEAAVDLAINVAPAEVTALVAADVANDDTGKVALSWTPSLSPDTAGYRCFAGTTLLADIPGAEVSGTEISGLKNSQSQTLRVVSYDGFGNQSPGVSVNVTARDDLPPLVTISGVAAGTYYSASVTPQVEIIETNLAVQTITLNGAAYDLSPVLQDGSYVLAVSATDVSGNTTSRTVAFTVDATAPVITVANLTDGGYYDAARIPEIAVVDANVEVSATTYLLDGQSYLPGTVVAGEGLHSLEISARDKAGNEATLTLHFVIDKTAPVITITGVIDSGQYKADLTLLAAVVDTYLKSSSVSLNGQPFVSGTLVSAEGAYVLTVNGEDEAGNSSSQTVHFVVDKTAPMIAISGVTNNGHFNVDVNPATNVTDTYLKSSSVTLNGQTFVSGTPVSAEGEYVLSVSGEDEAGNSATQTIRFVIDKTAPVIVVTGVANGAHYNADLTPTTGVSDTYLKSSSITLNGQTFVSGTLVAAEGEYVLTVSGEDEAGNSATQTVRFVIDRTAPVVTITGVTNNGHFNVDVNPATNVTDTYLKSSSVTLNGQTFVSGTPVSAEGEYVLSVSGEDEAGNSTAQTVRFVIDKTAPVITITGVTNNGHYNVDVNPATNVTDTYLKSSSVTLNGQTFVSGTPISAEGEYVLSVSGEDEAGNSTAQTVRFVIDKTAPVITIAGIVDGNHFNIDVAPTVSITDTYLKSSSVTLNGQPFVSGTPISAEGEYVLSVSGEDEAGNSATQTIRFVIDKTPPVIVVSGVANGGLYHVDVTPVVTINDLYLLSSNLTINNQPFVSATAISAEGSHSLAVTAEDRAGNRAAVVFDFVIDKTPPTTTSTVGAPRYSHSDQLFIAAETAITLSSVDAGVVSTGVDYIEFTLDQAAPWNSYGGAFVLAAMGEGHHDLYYRAVDRAGNLESAQTLPVILDKSAPVTSISASGAQFTAADGSLFVAATTEFSLASTDNLSGVLNTAYRIDGGAWVAYAPFTLAGLADGAHMIGYRSIDNVNNVEVEHALNVMIDNTAPVTTLRASDPKYIGDALYVTATTEFTLAATDNLSGVASTEYRIDGGTWTVYAPFNLIGLADGEHTIGFRSVDNGSNVETELLFTVVIDNTAPVTTISIGDPKYRSEALYVTGATEFTLAATDNLSGVAKTEYRIDGGSGVAYAPFSLTGLPDGEHLIEFSSVDKILNVEETQAVTVVVDNTPPATSIVLNHQSYIDGEVLLVSRDTEITLNAFDQLSGVAITLYRFDDSAIWSPYDGNFRLTDLAYGVHSLHYRSIDNVSNREEEKSVIITLVGVEVETEILNRPRVLVWTEDPAKQGGNNRPSWSIEEVRALVDEALGVPDIYTTMTADKDEFRSLLRSGIYNMVMILNQDIPFDTIFLREMREAVNRGMGLLVSSWGNSVPPLWQEVFSVDFKGSLSMNEEERILSLFDSPVSVVQSLTANGRVLRTVLDGGTLAGILPAESTCEGLRGLSLRYPQAMALGDRLTVSLSVPQGKKSVVVDEEVLTISALPQGAVNRFTGNVAGDIAIAGITAEGITLSLASPYGYLEPSYTLSVKVERVNGSTIAAGPVAITPVCGANLSTGLNIGPFQVVAVEEDRVKIGDDLPAVVLGEYGEGRTAFLSYNIIESALKGQRSEHLGLLRQSAAWLLPEAVAPEAGGVALIESRVKLLGANLDLQAVDTLGEGLRHQPLFELTHTPLSYTFHLADGEQAIYRYFVRITDRQGVYDKTTAVLLGLDDGFVPFANYLTSFSVGDDSYTLLLKALAWVDGQLPAHPEDADALLALRDELVRIDTLPRTTPAEAEILIHQTVQTLHQVGQLTFDSVELRILLDQYLRIVEGTGYFD